MIAWDMMVARKAEIEGKTAKVIEPLARDEKDEKVVAAAAESDADDEGDESEGDAQPLWRERLERRAQGKRRRRR
jgi:hypothetical protein